MLNDYSKIWMCIVHFIVEIGLWSCSKVRHLIQYQVRDFLWKNTNEDVNAWPAL